MIIIKQRIFSETAAIIIQEDYSEIQTLIKLIIQMKEIYYLEIILIIIAIKEVVYLEIAIIIKEKVY